MKKNKTFADEFKALKARYYKTRKPGEDSLTDDAFNREAKALMQAQEAVKPKEPQQDPQFANQEFAKGGNLPKYNNGSFLNSDPTMNLNIGYDGTNFGQNSFYSPNQFQQQSFYSNMSPGINPDNNSLFMPGAARDRFNYDPSNFKQGSFAKKGFDLMNSQGRESSISPVENKSFESQIVAPNGNQLAYKKRIPSLINGNDQPNNAEFDGDTGGGGTYSPTASIIGPMANIATDAIASHILKKGTEDRRTDLLKDINVNLGRVSPQQVDFGRERANIKSGEALTEASGRYAARGARSASEAASIQNMARLASRRQSGAALSGSLQKEEMQNAALRTKASDTNRELAAKENVMEQRQRMDINQKYGNQNPIINADLARTTGATIQNYLTENQQMRSFYDQANMLNPNFQLDFQQEYAGLSPFQQKLRRLGIGNISPNKVVTNG